MTQAYPPAKINLTLAVGERRPDGFHELRSVFLRIGLADQLTVAISETNDTLAITGFECPVAGNLVLRAFDLLRSRLDAGLPGLAATLDKRIPLGAGLGGGSSDAAAALDVAANTWGVGLSAAQRMELALQLGSDVPFFAADMPAALVEGRGERVTPLPQIHGDVGLLLLLSPMELSTAEVFRSFDRLDRPPSQDRTNQVADALRAGLTGAQLADLTADLGDANDLWVAASYLTPELTLRRREVEARSGRQWLLSGSGPTLFAVLPSVAEAVEVGSGLLRDRSDVFRGVILCATDLTSPEPAWRQQWPTDP